MAFRVLLFVFGFAFLALAVIGALLPIMPTVPFMLLAIWCFARSSERMHQWILNLPIITLYAVKEKIPFKPRVPL